MKFTLTLIFLLLLFTLSVQAQTSVQVGRVQVASVGRTVVVPIELITPSQNFRTGGFELLVQYDPTLIFQSAAAGQLLTNCDWEYFTYRVDPGDLIRLISIADIANGPVHPTCNGEAPGALATLEFIIPNNTALQCQVLPIQWYWRDCGDNAFSSPDGSTLIISKDIYSWDGSNEFNVTYDTTFPTYTGAPAACLLDSNNTTIRSVDYHNGGVSMMTYDLEDPFATCPTNMTVANDPGVCGTVVTFDAYIGDNCPGGSIACDPPSGSFFPVGNNVITCVATDAVGRIDSCNFTITVVDTVPPLLTCPNDTTVQTTKGLCGAFVNFNLTATDLCSATLVQSIPPSGTLFPLGNTTVTAIATDTWGQTDSCSFIITVIDNEAPVVSCQDTIRTTNDPSLCGAVVGYNATVSDNCFASLYCSPDSGSFFHIGMTSVLCMASDQAGNSTICTLIVIVEDNEQPTINLPDSIVTYNDPGECSDIVTFVATANDNCDSATIVFSPPSGSLFPVGLSYVFCEATDASSNIYRDSFTVTVVDSQPPTLIYQDTIVVSNEPGLCGSQVDFQLSATDNCDSVTIESNPPSGSFFNIGTTHVVALATDGSGLVDSGVIVVTIIDTEQPTLVCHNDTVVLIDSGLIEQQVDWTIEATDNCANLTVNSNPPSGSSFPVGIHSVVSVATDSSGNADSCLFTIEVVEPDIDNDGVADWSDNCPTISNAGQHDTDNNGIGDACCCLKRGNVDDLVGPGGPVDVSDLTYLVSFLFGSRTPPPCPEQGNVDALDLTGVAIDVSDLTYLVAFLFQAGPEPPSCS